MKIRFNQLIIAIIAAMLISLILLQKMATSGKILFILKEKRTGSGEFTYSIREFRGSNSIFRYILNTEDSFFYSCEIHYNNRIPIASQTHFVTQSYRLRDPFISIEEDDVVFSLDRRTELRAKNIALNETIVKWEYVYK